MVPQAFVEYELRVYDKRCMNKRSDDGHETVPADDKAESNAEKWK